MNAEEVRAALQAAREAGKALRARSREDVHADLARVFDDWSSAGVFQDQLESQLQKTGVMTAGLEGGLSRRSHRAWQTWRSGYGIGLAEHGYIANHQWPAAVADFW